MKKSLTLGLLACICMITSAQQNFFNAWYASDPNRPFVKLLVAEDAIYELTLSDLTAAGHDLSQAQPDSIQLFYRGEEIPLVVERDAQGAFESLSFYGQRNDGAVEAEMYRDPITGTPAPSVQPNPNFSIYSDTSAYFLTWGSEKGKRYTLSSDTNYGNYTAEDAYPFEAVWEPHPDSLGASKAISVIAGGGAYDSFHSLNCDFVPGEGYVSASVFRPTVPLATTFLRTPHPISTLQDVRFQLRIFHRSNSEHDIRVNLSSNLNALVLDTAFNFPTIAVKTYERTLNTTLSTQPELTFQALNQTADNNHLTSIRIRYQRMTDLANSATTRISELTGNVTRYFRFANARGSQHIWAYDPANSIRYEGLIQNGEARLILGGQFYGKSVEVITDQGFKKPIVAPQAHLRNLCAPDSGAAFVIIAHRDLDSSAYAYAAYRDTSTAGAELLSAQVVFIDEIYDEFSYGAPTPQAIQQFVNCALANWRKQPKYIFLWGKGRTWMRGFPEPIVPTWGYPASDMRFVTPYLEDKTAQLAIGRVNVYDNREGFAYLDKVMEFERTGKEPWRNDGVFLGAGTTQGSANAIDNTISSITTCFQDSLGKNRQTAIFTFSNPLSPNFHNLLSQGQSLIYIFSFLPNPAPGLLFEPFEYTNFSKYPLIMALGGIGGYFAGRESYGERWVKEPGRGCIAWIGNSTFGYVNPLRDYSRIFFCNELQPDPFRPIGEITRAAYQLMLDSIPGIQYRNHARQMNLQGDPALVIYPNFDGVAIEPELAPEVTIYPNPASEQLILKSKSELISSCRLMDLQGRVLLEARDLRATEIQLKVSNIAAGSYVVQYQTERSQGVKQVIIE